MANIKISWHLNNRDLDLDALRSAFGIWSHPLATYAKMTQLKCRRSCQKDDRDDIFKNCQTVSISRNDRRSEQYVHEAEEDKGVVAYGEGSEGFRCEQGELSYRHPGTCGPELTPLRTKAAKMMYTIDLVSPGGSKSCALLSSYEMQLSIRVDNEHYSLYYDCFEYKPEAIEMEKESLPALRQMRDFERTVYTKHPMRNYTFWNVSDIMQLDDSDPQLDEKVHPHKRSIHGQNIETLHFKAMSETFMNSKLWRIKVPLSSVVGIRLEQAGSELGVSGGIKEDQRDLHAVLILELSSPVAAADNAFAVRTVGSQCCAENQFRSVGDWTQGGVASQAIRHYIYGSIYEIKELAAHLCCIDEQIESMLAATKRKEKDIIAIWPNTLAGISHHELNYQATPEKQLDLSAEAFLEEDKGSDDERTDLIPEGLAWNGKIKSLKWAMANIICDKANSGSDEDLQLAMAQSQALGFDLMNTLEMDIDEEPDSIPDY
uniref:Uncharacterized protein n=1 Tax=Odontella aurita TaxID=265563 RepID=A0A7S4K968_9STRA